MTTLRDQAWASAMPGKLRDRVLNAPEDVKSLGTDFIDTVTELPGEIEGEGVKLWRRTMGVDSGKEGPKLAPELEFVPESERNKGAFRY